MTYRRIAPPGHRATLSMGWGARASWVALLLALLCLQQLGLAHRYAHGVVPGAVVEYPHPVSGGDGLPAHDQAACQLLDQLCAGDSAPTPVGFSLSVQPVWASLPAPRLLVWGVQGAFFWARAPPARG